MDKIKIIGAKEHNLKNINLELPKNKLIVFTGVSGSGKSSLAFDTIYAEGQRRYIESLSAYARQFLGRLEKPDVESLEGLAPSIAIEQKSVSHNPRSTVGTITEIYDYMRLLFARLGEGYCLKCNVPIRGYTIDEILDRVLNFEGKKALFLSPIVRNRKGEYKKLFETIRRDGFIRVRINGKFIRLDEENPDLDSKRKHVIDIVIDRIKIDIKKKSRIFEAIEMALNKSNGYFILYLLDDDKEILFSEHNSCSNCGFSLPEVVPQLFSFNSPIGMCENCHGLGVVRRFSEDKAIVDENLSIMDGAIRFFGKLHGRENSWQYRQLKALSKKYNFDLDDPYKSISKSAKKAIFYGDDNLEILWERAGKRSYISYEGIANSIYRLFHETNSDENRDFYSSFLEESVCPVCNGARLKKEALSVRINGKNIFELSRMSLKNLRNFFNGLEFSDEGEKVGDIIIREIDMRLHFLNHVGLGYLSLDRKAPTLSGGEAQRIRLASQIGSGLTGVIYVLDEPSIGLHQRDNRRLLDTLIKLRDIGNTVIVVEHDEDTIRHADFLVDFGPGAGEHGGNIVAVGTPDEVINHPDSLTAKYLRGEMGLKCKINNKKKFKRNFIEIKGAKEHNLKNINVRFPIGSLSVVTGVSGSGKSTLIYDILYPALKRKLGLQSEKPGVFYSLRIGDSIKRVLNISQDPIGRTPRSNPVIYVGGFTPIREMFSRLPEARVRGYSAGRFSFNVKGGRCEACQGSGRKRIEMLFLPDVYVTCEVCNGLRFNRETLEIRFKGYSISDVLNLSVNEARELFNAFPGIVRYLNTLIDVGLGYIKLGQPATTLSGGEAQRVKLAKELTKISRGNTVYLLDEPTTGLHFADVEKLIAVLKRLVDKGNTVIVIEHNMDVIKVADYIVDLGPEGGDEGGRVVYQGPLKGILGVNDSYTGKYLMEVCKKDNIIR